MKRLPLLLTALAAGGALAGCGGASPTTAATSTPASTAGTVAIRNFAFGPTPLTVSRGTTVTWTNHDASTHTATAVDRSFDTGNIDPGKSVAHTFDTPGTFAYRCNIHQYMTATIVVTG